MPPRVAIPTPKQEKARLRWLKWYETNREHAKAYGIAYRKANSAKIVTRVKVWRNANPGHRNANQREHYENNRETYRAKGRAHYAANREEIRARYKKWRSKPENREKDNAKTNKWRQNHPEQVNVHWHASRARRMKAKGHHTPKDIARIRKAQRDRCAMPNCRKPLKGRGHRDHIIPLKLGGTNWPRNLQLLCPTCNHAKNAKDPIIHIQSLGFLI
jgi:5-methylcytosine-specific restriction endonuclease McrA